jgi:hypothetical protein
VDCIFATVGRTGSLFDDLCHEATATGGTVTTANAAQVHLGASTAGHGAVALAQSPTVMVAAFGSGVRAIGGPAVASRALTATTTALTDGSADDIVALVVTDGIATAVAGRGDHRLFAASVDDGLAVCSHLGVLVDAMTRHLGRPPRVDRSYEDVLLGFGFLPDGRTVFDGIATLAPGTSTVLHPDGTSSDRGALATPVSGAPEGPPPSFDDAVTALYDRFVAAVAEQAAGATRHAVLLGGLDSMLVASCLASMGHEVHTYTFGFGDPAYEQRNVAAFTAATGTTHHTVPITADAIMDGLEEFGATYASPGPQPHYQLHTLVAARAVAADGFGHVFTGDGADAVFLGYPTVSQRARLGQRLTAVPGPVATASQSVLATRAVERHLGHVARAARASLASLSLPDPARGHLPTRYLDDAALARLRTGPPPPQAETVDEVRRRLATGLGHLDPVRLAFDGHAVVGQSRVKVDGAVAATGVTQSSPFRHPMVRDYVAALPTDFLRRPGEPARAAGKELLVAMVRRHHLVPGFAIDQAKQSPSDSPVDQWYAGELRPRVVELLDGLPFGWDRRYLDDVLRPKWAEQVFRDRVSISHHCLQVVGLLASYASFTRRGSVS